MPFSGMLNFGRVVEGSVNINRSGRLMRCPILILLMKEIPDSSKLGLLV